MVEFARGGTKSKSIFIYAWINDAAARNVNDDAAAAARNINAVRVVNDDAAAAARNINAVRVVNDDAAAAARYAARMVYVDAGAIIIIIIVNDAATNAATDPAAA